MYGPNAREFGQTGRPIRQAAETKGSITMYLDRYACCMNRSGRNLGRGAKEVDFSFRVKTDVSADLPRFCKHPGGLPVTA